MGLTPSFPFILNGALIKMKTSLRYFFYAIDLILSKLKKISGIKKPSLNRLGFNFNGWMMGFEPTTPGTTNQCSNQLSYNHHNFAINCNYPKRFRGANIKKWIEMKFYYFKKDNKIYRPIFFLISASLGAFIPQYANLSLEINVAIVVLTSLSKAEG